MSEIPFTLDTLKNQMMKNDHDGIVSSHQILMRNFSDMGNVEKEKLKMKG